MSGVRPTVAIFGVPGSALNLGVGALRDSALTGFFRRVPDANITVFDDGWGTRPDSIVVDGRERPLQLCGARNSRRLHKRESYLNMKLSALAGGAGNPGLAVLDACDAVWDVSGGDSFSDIYGRQRFNTVTLPKDLALARGRNLLLLPQTYGPFRDQRVRERARRATAQAAQAWARDGDSFVALQELLGDQFDATRHLMGVDLAFGLPRTSPAPDVAEPLRAWLSGVEGLPLAGLNVSGLLINQPDAVARYGLTLDYEQLMHALADRLLETGAALLLVPHVLGVSGGVDNDEQVTAALQSRLSAKYPGLVATAPRGLGARERKWLISKVDWFCGARMHATIAALSSGVPTAALAYSGKVRGVFDSCALADQVVDARQAEPGAALEQLWQSWCDRDATRQRLAHRLPTVLDRADRQMDEMVAITCAWAASDAGRE